MIRIAILLISLVWAGQSKPTRTESDEKLIVFLQAEKDQDFATETLPQLKNYCQRNQIDLQVKAAEEGLPAEISSTPTIVFQAKAKRLIYAGRYREFSSIENFVRTSRFRSPSNDAFCKEEVWLKQAGRTQLMAVAKITDLKGRLPTGYDAERFAKQAINGISNGLDQYASKTEACISQTDRVFYLDFHPYRAENGQLYLSVELYSQFSCVEPIYTQTVIQFVEEDWVKAFREASRKLSLQIENTMANSLIGDALSVVWAEVPLLTWDELGLAFPAGVESETIRSTELSDLAGKWTYVGAPDPKIPALSFHFQAPLERYAGEISQIQGELDFDAENRLLSGSFSVDVSSLSMGMDDLDEKVLRKYLKAQKYPLANFAFDLAQNPLKIDRNQQIQAINGSFNLMNHSIELPMQTQFQMITDTAGQAQIWASGQFQLRITEDFDIEGPDGPSPNRETMIFYFSILLKQQN